MSTEPPTTPAGVELTREPQGRQAEVLTHDALEFVAGLHRAFNGRRRELLTTRRQRRERDRRAHV